MLLSVHPFPSTIFEILRHDSWVVCGNDTDSSLLNPLMFVILDDLAIKQLGFALFHDVFLLTLMLN